MNARRLILTLTIPLIAWCSALGADTPGETGTLKPLRRPVRMDRGLQSVTFIPKGLWMAGASLSYNELNFDNSILVILKDIDATGYTFSLSPVVGYFIKDNTAVGIRAKYSRTLGTLDNLSLSLGEGLNLSLNNVDYIGHDINTSLFLRSYMPLGNSKVFAFFSEVQLGYAFGQNKYTSGVYEEETLSGTYSEHHKLSLGFAPGLTAFVQDWLAAEVQMGVMGLGFKWQEQVTNQVEHGSSSSFSGSFKLDLFSINIGITIYL